ncbi:TRAP transporter TatT component family protein [Alteromonas sp. a30]|uniref:TRAP transporter TatT component family protein n=1 Tax=Alteromonas sp. a30 TaxID=2730917 RepID=UPI002280633A|nr:TRAP transporter TatT component family protein [Alteromonas sp. a30]MCY7295154.1 hypothetical protein [Alteromonas sp. a30]
MPKVSLSKWLALTLVVATSLLSGCSSFVSGATKNLANQLQSTISNHNDPELVKDAVPAYMLMVESLLRSDPDNVDLLVASSSLYSAYASVFVDDLNRQQRLSTRAFLYGKQAICEYKKDYCDIDKLQVDALKATLDKMDEDDVSMLFALGSAWAGWIKSHSNDFNAVADVPKIEIIMRRIVALDEGYQNGNAHLYLGVLATLIPPTLGGKPEIGRMHFERAMQLSNGENLMVHVTFAQQYARLLFDRELHDRLLRQVMQSDAKAEGLTLTNWLAKQRAEELLTSADDYF